MNSDLIVTPDAISKEAQDILEETMLGDCFPWYYRDTSTYTDDMPRSILSGNTVETPLFTHIFCSQNIVTSDFFKMLLPIIEAMPFKFQDVLRIKGNLTTKHPNVDKFKHGVPHVDYFLPNVKTAIYYVNDSSGDTIIFDERQTTPKCDPEVYGRLRLDGGIEPRKGKLVVFDGNRIHAANCPRTHNSRVTINFNFLV